MQPQWTPPPPSFFGIGDGADTASNGNQSHFAQPVNAVPSRPCFQALSPQFQFNGYPMGSVPMMMAAPPPLMMQNLAMNPLTNGPLAAPLVPIQMAPPPLYHQFIPNLPPTQLLPQQIPPSNPVKPINARNIFIPKNRLKDLHTLCDERFRSTQTLFEYFKRSVAMQFNSGQAVKHNVWTVGGGKGENRRTAVIVLNLDLHFNDGAVLYLVAEHHRGGNRATTKYAVEHFLTAQQVFSRFGITNDRLPLSSRTPLLQQLKNPPLGLSSAVIRDIIWNTDFKNLPQNESLRQRCNTKYCRCTLFETESVGSRKCADCDHDAAAHGVGPEEVIAPRLRAREIDFEESVASSWSDNRRVPVVVSDRGQTWIEWKKFVRIPADGEEAWTVALSMKFDGASSRNGGRWSFKSLDSDPRRIDAEHRLISDFVPDEMYWSYEDLLAVPMAKCDLD